MSDGGSREQHIALRWQWPRITSTGLEIGQLSGTVLLSEDDVRARFSERTRKEQVLFGLFKARTNGFSGNVSEQEIHVRRDVGYSSLVVPWFTLELEPEDHGVSVRGSVTCSLMAPIFGVLFVAAVLLNNVQLGILGLLVFVVVIGAVYWAECGRTLNLIQQVVDGPST